MSEAFDVVATALDAEARRHVCASLGFGGPATPAEQIEQIRQRFAADGERLLEELRPEDLIASLRLWWFPLDDEWAHLLGLRGASVEELRTGARRLMIEGWEPQRRSQRAIPGTVLRLCWYEAGAAHAGEFDDDDGLDDGTAGELADEAIYTIIAPERLDGRDRTGLRFEEGRPWVAGARFFERAQEQGQRLVVVFADAKATHRLVGWSFVRSLTVTSTTMCETGPIVRLRRGRADSIRKLSDGQPLAFNYIRPYVPCLCPSFVRRTFGRMRDLLSDGPPRPVVPPEPAPLVSARPATPTNRSAPAPAPGARATLPVSSDDPVVAFSWGYEGWGNHTAELVEMVDAVEAARGFGPPLFVDVRLRRQVRAIGFRDRAFERLLGPDRYVWLEGLGNQAIGDRSLKKALADPGAAKTLLELVVQRAAARSRVIFFCSCGSPLFRDTCHRGLVAKALIAAARKRATAVAVHEWPGGSPVVTEIDVSESHMRRLRAIGNAQDGTMRVPVPAGTPIARAAALPHFSLLRCRSGADECIAVSGAAILTTQGWMFPVHRVDLDPDLGPLKELFDRALASYKLEPLGADLHLPPRWRDEPLA